MENFKLRRSYQGFPQVAHHAGSPPPLNLSKAHHECYKAAPAASQFVVAHYLQPVTELPASIMDPLHHDTKYADSQCW